MALEKKITDLLYSLGAADVGFASVPEFDKTLCRAVSIVMPLSEAVVDEINGAPTYSYFHHYRTLNAHIDRCLLQAGLLLQREGWRYIPIPASQSTGGFHGRFSHKQAAVLAGLGTMGRNGLFLHRRYGPAVRLGTLFTNAPLPAVRAEPQIKCLDCMACVHACPAMAIPAGPVAIKEEQAIIDRQACSQYMKQHFQHIGRGAVCGVCISVCPMRKQSGGSF